MLMALILVFFIWIFIQGQANDRVHGAADTANINGLDGKEVKPVVTIVCNFSNPSKEIPSLLSLDDVIHLFHEFGHATSGALLDK